MEETNLQTGDASNQTENQTGATSTGEQPKAETQTQPSQEDAIKQAIAKALAEELPKHIEPYKREIQSLKDRARNEVERTRKQATSETLNLIRSATGDDPDLQQKLELAHYRTQDVQRQREEAEEANRRQQAWFDQQFKETHTELATDLGVDPNDKRIDWGENEPDYLKRLKIIQKSVAKVAKENQKASEEKTQKTLKDEMAKMRKDLGIDSVDTSNPVGAVSDGIPLEREKLRTWVAGLSTDEYTKYASKIRQLEAQGKIK